MDNTGSGSIELQAHAAALGEAIRDGKAVPAGRLFGLPELPGDDYWLDMAGATATPSGVVYEMPPRDLFPFKQEWPLLSIQPH